MVRIPIFLIFAALFLFGAVMTVRAVRSGARVRQLERENEDLSNTITH